MTMKPPAPGDDPRPCDERGPMRKARNVSPYEVVSGRLSRDASAESIEDVVARRLPRGARDRAIAKDAQALFDALPGAAARRRWFRWERLVADRAFDQDRALFDFGYECGTTDARAVSWSAGKEEPVAQRLRTAVLAEDMARPDRLRVMLLIALALVEPGDDP